MTDVSDAFEGFKHKLEEENRPMPRSCTDVNAELKRVFGGMYHTNRQWYAYRAEAESAGSK
jgi:hypothetical protein